MSTLFAVQSKYHDKGGTALKWLIFGSESSAPEDEKTLAYAQIFLLNADVGFSGSYGGGVYFGASPDNSYPFFATNAGGWSGAKVRHTLNLNYTGTWPARFMVDGSYADGTSNDKLVGKKQYVMRYLSYNDRGRDAFVNDTFKGEPWELEDSKYPLRGAWQPSPSVQAQCLSGTWIGVETIKDIDWSYCYIADEQTSRNVLCTAIYDTNVWQKGTVPWPTLTQAYRTSSYTASYAKWNHTSNMLTMYYKTKDILDLCSNKEEMGVKLYEGSYLCEAPADGTMTLDIKSLGVDCLSGNTFDADRVRIAFKSNKFNNSSTLTGDVQITKKNGVALSTPANYIELNKTSDVNTTLTLSVKKGSVWVKCRPMGTLTPYGTYAKLDIDNINLTTEE